MRVDLGLCIILKHITIIICIILHFCLNSLRKEHVCVCVCPGRLNSLHYSFFPEFTDSFSYSYPVTFKVYFKLNL